MDDIHITTIPKNASEEIRITLGEFNGHMLFNARVFFEAKDGTWRPSKAGLAFRVDRLATFVGAAEEALERARAEGLCE